MVKQFTILNKSLNILLVNIRTLDSNVNSILGR